VVDSADSSVAVGLVDSVRLGFTEIAGRNSHGEVKTSECSRPAGPVTGFSAI
jgi:hypothetical protein